MKKIFVAILTLSIVFSMGLFSSAAHSRNTHNQHQDNHLATHFRDVSADHWAVNSIEQLQSTNVMNGFDDGTFRPMNKVTKAELAVILARALNLDIDANCKSSFADINDDNWACKYIEASKKYMYDNNIPEGTKFHPEYQVFREDLIKAIIKASKINVVNNDYSSLSKFTDVNELSVHTKDFVNTALKYGIIAGSNEHNHWYINPKDSVSRAEVAVMITGLGNKANIEIGKVAEVKEVAEVKKVKNEESSPKVSISNDFTLNIDKALNGLNLKWDRQPNDMNGYGFRFYKVVASLNNSNPVYPANGYTVYITDINKISHHISLGDGYTNGDFNKFQSGLKYHIRITAVYEDKHYRNSNVIYTNVQ